MGAHPWTCSTPYKEPLQQTLQELRHHEFLTKVATDRSQFKTAQEIDEGIAEYIEECDADGTCSIIDIETINSTPEDFDCGCACPLLPATLIKLFGSEKPEKNMMPKARHMHALFEMIGRGQAAYIIFHEGGKPAELFFAGYSYD